MIFNGTNTRKPASRSSVELVFDNQDHRAGGQWNQYGEIAVKRVLTRDGNSSYYINNQPVRRRDVQDVFPGHGLGPRAYAIIGQGTISRIIESRPEELRLFLEEAAGVSKYKERRARPKTACTTRARTSRGWKTSCASSMPTSTSWKNRPRWPQRYPAAGRCDAQAAPAMVLKRADAEADQEKVRMDGLQAVNDLEARMADLRHVESELKPFARPTTLRAIR